jgi:hypothetical protein
MPILHKGTSMCILVKNGHNNGEKGGERQVLVWVCSGWEGGEGRRVGFYTIAISLPVHRLSRQ